jgi:hypothetical protein
MAAQVVQLATTAAVESTSVPSISTSSAWARNNIRSRYRSDTIDAARVERWAEAAGTGALAGRDLPAADALAADNRISALAAALRADGAAGGMDLLRAQVFVGLLLGRPAAAPANSPAADHSAASDDPADQPTAPADQPAAPANSPAMGDAAGAGAEPAGGSAAGGGGDRGGAAAGVSAGGGAETTAAAAAPAGLARVAAGPALSAGGPPGGWGPLGGWGRLAGSINLTVPLATLLGESAAPGEVAGFGPVPAAAAIQLAHARGGRTCECDLAPLCRLHHKIKQASGWRLEQPEPGVLQWTAPSGWRYTTTPHTHPT